MTGDMRSAKHRHRCLRKPFCQRSKSALAARIDGNTQPELSRARGSTCSGLQQSRLTSRFAVRGLAASSMLTLAQLSLAVGR